MAAITMLAFWIGSPLFFGYNEYPVITPILSCLLAAMGNVFIIGWRAGAYGPIRSTVYGTIFGMIVALPIYYLARLFL
jgi:hypothetical protein